MRQYRQQSIFIVLGIAILMAGCQTVSSKNAHEESLKTETPQDAQSAVKSVVTTYQEKGVRAKYCPLCGKHYAANLNVCPKDGTLLKEVQE